MALCKRVYPSLKSLVCRSMATLSASSSSMSSFPLGVDTNSNHTASLLFHAPSTVPSQLKHISPPFGVWDTSFSDSYSGEALCEGFGKGSVVLDRGLQFANWKTLDSSDCSDSEFEIESEDLHVPDIESSSETSWSDDEDDQDKDVSE